MCIIVLFFFFFFFKQKTAYEMRISDWSSDVCSSDLLVEEDHRGIGCAHAELVELGLAINTLGVHRYHDQTLVEMRFAVGGIDQHAGPVGLRDRKSVV